MFIKNLEIKNNLILAPMAGFTDVGFRYLAKKYGAGLTVTEMVSAKGIVYGNKDTAALLALAPNEDIKAVQLFGSESQFIYKACKNPLIAPFDVIDINMGCPMQKIVGNMEGSAMLKSIHNAKEVVNAAIEASGKPVTVKLRIGINGGCDIIDFCNGLQEAGASMLTVHARTREQLYSGKPNYDVITAIKQAVTIPVIANGDITDRQKMLDVLKITAADGVAIGRAALGNPYIFSEVQDIYPHKNIKQDLLAHIELLRQFYSDNVVCNLMKKHVGFYLKYRIGVAKMRQRINSSISLPQLLSCVDEFFD